MADKQKLTAGLILDGEVDVEKTTGAELATFIAENNLAVKPGRTKADTLNAIADALEDGAPSTPPASSTPAAAPAATEVEVDPSAPVDKTKMGWNLCPAMRAKKK